MNGYERAAEVPTAVYTPEPLIVGPGQALSPAQGYTQPVVVIQQAAPQQSWLKEHQGQLIAGGAAAVLGIGIFLAIAVVAIAVAVTGTVCLVVIKTLFGESKN
jgi:hypothetical protein